MTCAATPGQGSGQPAALDASPASSETPRTPYEEYLICKQRGHSPSGIVTASLPPQSICDRCGTYYWYEHRLLEHSVPPPPDHSPESEEQA